MYRRISNQNEVILLSNIVKLLSKNQYILLRYIYSRIFEESGKTTKNKTKGEKFLKFKRGGF